ncbi:hypothetical protein FSP39_017635 [Pinctada imbricata]|uniref:G-protein coupled receptors family 1 profile domain-containing protein n=1 Tax=Pinctada imbricata TaxID=66713 RepID=A0AA89BPI9_PINIB|nr:hypothetical protein FSP39_017635 [Pinctada imbricata]
MAECLNNSIGNITPPEEDNSPEAELEQTIHFIFMELGVPLVCIFGLVGNILNLMVLTREKIQCSLTRMEKSAHIGLIALAVSDFMFCLLALLFTLLPSKPPFYNAPSGVMYYHWLGGNFITLFIVSSTWLIVVMAGERYLAVCHPFKARNFISLKKTKITIIVVFVTCLISTVPLFFEKEIKKTLCSDMSSIYQIVVRSDYGSKGVSIRRLVWAIVFDFIPSLALLVFNTCLVWKIHSAKKLRKQMAPGHDVSRNTLTYHSQGQDSSETKHRMEGEYRQMSLRNASIERKNDFSFRSRIEADMVDSNGVQRMTYKTSLLKLKTKKRQSDSALNSVTATLVAVVLLFLILVSPSEVLKFIFSQIQEQSQAGEKRKLIVLHVTNFMQSVNFSVNFVLYCAVNKTFRSTLGSLFCYCFRSKTPAQSAGHIPVTHQQYLS